MSISRIALLLCAALLLSPLRAGAADLPVAEPMDFSNPATTACQNADECVIIHPACSAPIVVNTHYFGQVDNFYKRFGNRVTCDPALEVPQVKSKQCLQHRCVLELVKSAPAPVDEKVQKDPSYCDKDDECQVVFGDCCAKSFVNKQIAPAMEADIRSKADMAKCFYWDRQHVRNLRCEKHKCTADLEAPNENVDDSRHTSKDRCEQ